MILTYVLSSGYYDAYYLNEQKVRKLIKKGIIGEVYNVSGKNQISNVAIIKTILSLILVVSGAVLVLKGAL